jgi:hypothetical protein
MIPDKFTSGLSPRDMGVSTRRKGSPVVSGGGL